MVKSDQGSIEINGSFHQILAEVTTVVGILQKKLDNDPMLQGLFKHKSIIEVMDQTLETQKKLQEQGISAEEYVKRNFKK